MQQTGTTTRPVWPLAGFGIAGGLVVLILVGVMLSGVATIPPGGESVGVEIRGYQPGFGAVAAGPDGSFTGGAIPVVVLSADSLDEVSGPVSATWASSLGQTVLSLRRERASELPAMIPLASRSMYPDQYTFLLTRLDSDGNPDQLLTRVVVRVAQ